jgi:hypothetical protein
MNVNVSWQPDQYSRFATRGGPIMIQPGSVGFRMGFGLDRRKPYSGNLGFNYQRGARDSGNDISVNANISMRPSPPLQIQIEPSFGIQSDAGRTSPRRARCAPLREATSGDLERKTASLETRQYAFSPTPTFRCTQALLA